VCEWTYDVGLRLCTWESVGSFHGSDSFELCEGGAASETDDWDESLPGDSFCGPAVDAASLALANGRAVECAVPRMPLAWKGKFS
jgi:hypothetical protein